MCKIQAEVHLPEVKDKMDKLNNEEPGQGMARRISTELLKLGIEQGQIKKTMAEACGVNDQAIYKWFDGTTKNPQATSLALICQKFDLDMSAIVLNGQTKPAEKKNEESESSQNYGSSKEGPPNSDESRFHDEEIEKPHAGSIMDRVKKLLLAANVPAQRIAAQLAQICAIPLAEARKWTSGQIPDAPHLAVISRHYGVDLGWLVTGVLLPNMDSGRNHEDGSTNFGEGQSLGKRLTACWAVNL